MLANCEHFFYLYFMNSEHLIDKFLEYAKHAKNYSDNTIIAYRDDLLQFRIFLDEQYAGMNLLEVELPILRQWMAELSQRQIQSKSIRRKVSSLNAFFTYAKKVGLISKSPVSLLQKPKSPKTLVNDIAEKDLENLFNESFPTDYEQARDYTILMILYCTGMRRSELCSLTSESFLNGFQYIKVLGKRNKERFIPMIPELQGLLLKYMKIKDKCHPDKVEYLFISKKGKKMTPALVYHIVRKYLSGVSTASEKSPHTLRHSFATHLLNRGADIMAIKELMGHSSLAATQVYTHNAVEKLKKVYNKAHPRGD